MFAGERPALGPLPIEPFRYYQYSRRTVHLDGCVEAASAYYSTPPGWIGRRGDVQWEDINVRLLDQGTGQPGCASTCVRNAAGIASPTVTGPPAPHRRPSLCLPPPSEPSGPVPAISAVRDHIHQHEGAAGVRRILGVLSLARKHGPAIVEDAATTALERGVPSYRFLKRYLDRHPVAPLSLR